jgi:hypothetical protein
MKHWILYVCIALAVVATGCVSPLPWDVRVAIYEVHHALRIDPSLDAAAELQARGVPDRDLPAALQLLHSIEHVGQ